MATPEERWDQLIPVPGQAVYQRVDPMHPLDLYYGRGPAGERLLLLLTPDELPADLALRGLRLRTGRRPDGRGSLLIESATPAVEGVFGRLCEDLIEHSRTVVDPRHPVAALMRRLGQWVELLARSPAGLLEPTAVRGLFGELVALRDVVAPACGMPAAVQGWVGPQGADQDFRTGDRAWEIKTILPAAMTLRIASERQLCPALPLELVVVRLEEVAADPAALSLNALVREMRALAATDLSLVQRLDDRLAQAGYLPRAEYDRPAFQVLDVLRHAVTAGFPRLCAAAIPPGVEGVRYEVRLSACTPFRVEASGQRLEGNGT